MISIFTELFKFNMIEERTKIKNTETLPKEKRKSNNRQMARAFSKKLNRFFLPKNRKK